MRFEPCPGTVRYGKVTMHMSIHLAQWWRESLQRKLEKPSASPWCFITYRTIPLLPMSDQNCFTKKTYRPLLQVYYNFFLYFSFILLTVSSFHASFHQYSCLRLVFELALQSCRYPAQTFTHAIFNRIKLFEVKPFQGKHFHSVYSRWTCM